MGPYEGVELNSPYLKVNSVVCYLSPLQGERGEVGKISPIGSAHFYLSAYFQNNKLEKGEYGEGGGKE